jgi:2-polyprenyl-6-methoxyphenol hydroxylase-like FAD-dependent oxidoreductase
MSAAVYPCETCEISVKNDESTASTVTEVLVVGAGPVGACLAGDLGQRGIKCTVVEATDGSVRDPRLHAVNIRTMELARRWGLVDALRNCGWPAEHLQDVVYTTKIGGYELGRLAWPSISEMTPPAQSPVFAQRCPQNWFNPILHKFAKAQTSVDLRFLHRLVSFVQADDHVTALIEDLENDTQYSIKARFMVACDGGRSFTRKALGLQREKAGPIGFAADGVFRSPALAKRNGRVEAGRYTIITPQGMSFSLLPMDGKELYRMMLYVEPTKATADRVLDAIRYSIGEDIPFDMVGDVLHWVPRVTMAEQFRVGRIFIAGDAAHTMPTAGGFGMNTGILDAADLGWKLAAVLQGWGGPKLLDSYHVERKPAAQRISTMASAIYKQFHVMGDEIKAYGNATLEESPAGVKARTEIGDKLTGFFRREFNAIGGALGYKYEGSPICIPDGSEPPEDSMVDYIQTSRPGHRAPHAWIGKGLSTLDLFGDGFTIIHTGGEMGPCAAFQESATRRNIPLRVVSYSGDPVRSLYPKNLTLIRPDGHVAWRGDEFDQPPEEVLSIVTGSGPTTA